MPCHHIEGERLPQMSTTTSRIMPGHTYCKCLILDLGVEHSLDDKAHLLCLQLVCLDSVAPHAGLPALSWPTAGTVLLHSQQQA